MVLGTKKAAHIDGASGHHGPKLHKLVAVQIIEILVMALGAGLAVWGVINLLEGYGSDNPAAKSQGIKQLMAN